MFQVPWEIAADKQAAFSPAGFLTPFENVPVAVVNGFPDFFFATPGSGSGFVLALHEDFSGPVTPQSRAHPGEIVHVFLTGLGVTSPRVETGAVTPADTPYVANAKVQCTLDYVTPMEILFAGLAPGFVGLNQLDMRLPGTLTNADPEVSCVVFQYNGYVGGSGSGRIAASR
jgi:uncharacterized protein (TIGR03437 family)